MVDSYKGQPLEERTSQKLGWSGYMKELAYGLIPFGSAAAAIAFGKLTKQKIMPLDGSPDIFTKAQLFATKKTFKGAKIDWDKMDLVPWLTVLYRNPEDKLRVTHNFWNGIKGFEFGAIPLAFHIWHRQEKQRLDLTSTYDSLKKLESLKPSDDELAAENASLKQQLEFVRSHPETKVSQQKSHEGTVQEGREHKPSHDGR